MTVIFTIVVQKDQIARCYIHAVGNKATIHQLATMLSTSKYVLFPGHSHLLTTGADDPSLAGTQTTIKVKGHQH